VRRTFPSPIPDAAADHPARTAGGNRAEAVELLPGVSIAGERARANALLPVE